MAIITSLHDAVATEVQDGDVIAMEGFTHLIPFAAAHEVIRQQCRDLTLVRMTPDLIYDQLIGAGCARKIVFSWGGNPGVGSLHRLRDAVERGWPAPLEVEEHSHAGMANAFHAGAAGLPFATLRGYAGSDLRRVNMRCPETVVNYVVNSHMRRVNTNIRSVTCPFTGEELAAVPAIRPDVSIVHAQRADRAGNVLLEGIIGIQKEAILAASRSVVTVEEIVDDLAAPSPNSVIMPAWTIDAVAVAPGGAKPSYTHGYYERDNAFYLGWDAVSRDRDQFTRWIETNVLATDSPRV